MKHGRSSSRGGTSGALAPLARELVEPIIDLDEVVNVWLLTPHDTDAPAHIWVRLNRADEEAGRAIDDVLRSRLERFRGELEARGRDLDVSVMLDDGAGRLRPLDPSGSEGRR